MDFSAIKSCSFTNSNSFTILILDSVNNFMDDAVDLAKQKTSWTSNYGACKKMCFISP